MAVSLRFLGQAAAKQSFGLPAGATPRVLLQGGKTPKTPKTPACALAFFEDSAHAARTPKTPGSALAFFEDCAHAARTPKTPGRQAPPSFFGDALPAGPRSIASHVSWTLQVPAACDGSPSASPATSPATSSPAAMRRASYAGQKHRWADAPGNDAGAASSPWTGFVSFISDTMEAVAAPSAPTVDACVLLGRGQAQAAAPAMRPAAVAGPEGARASFLARRRRIAERSAAAPDAAEPPAVAPDAAPDAAPAPTLLRPEARARPQPQPWGTEHSGGVAPADDASAAATQACELFLARRRRAASRSVAFVV
mmetsp:Transcript_81797/g.176818  ORF Transcript_81797/g.176818 Transcript_81797/m.176818 type:complete len:310 (-) Transcript_81797:512-1441(-)